MTFKKTIRLYLMDADPNGRIKCELSNWTGLAFKIPRVKIKDSSDREELTNRGVYFLLGEDEEGNNQVYIGEAENVFLRLTQQLGEKDFWNEAIAFVSKDDNLNKAHIKFLENQLYNAAKNANRYTISNKSIPSLSNISESDEAEMEEFMSNVMILSNSLGHKIFGSKREKQKKKTTIYFTSGPRGADASGEQTSDGFLVFKGSKVANDVVTSISKGVIKRRETMINNFTLVNKGSYYELTEDTIFTSPSAAADVVLGRSANGLTEWKTKEGKTLKDVEETK